MAQLAMFTDADVHIKANEAFYRGVTGDWGDRKLTSIMGYLRADNISYEIIGRITTAMIAGRNAKHRILCDWQQRINKWHKEGKPELCADLGPQIGADIKKAVAPLAPFVTETQAEPRRNRNE